MTNRLARLRAKFLFAFSLLASELSASEIQAQVVSYECHTLPVSAGWILDTADCDPSVWADDGWYYQHVELCPGWTPPGGQQEILRRSLAEFDGAPDFFVEWRVESDAPHSDLVPWSGGATLSISGHGEAFYRCVAVSDGAWRLRDNRLPSIFPNFQPGTPHTFRIELRGQQAYAWLIDGQVVDAGTPKDQFPLANPKIQWGTYAAWGLSTSRWDYIRYGRLTHPTGDCNCDGLVNNFDIDPFVLAISDEAGYAAAHPGCNRMNADCDNDGRVDNFDVDAFVELLGG